MEFPFGHRRHQHHHHRANDNDDQRTEPHFYPPPNTAPPPPPYFQEPPPPSVPHYYPPSEYAPPPPSQTHFYHSSHHQDLSFLPQYPPPPTQSPSHTHVSHTSHHQEFNSFSEYPPPPPAPMTTTTHVAHVSHESSEPQTEPHHSYRPHLSSFIQHHTHQSGLASGLDFRNKPSYKVYCKAEPNFLLTIRDGKVVLAPSDPSDQFQNWYKDEKYSTRVKDEDGFPCFALVNKACGMAMKHSIGDSHPVQLIHYNPDVLDESVLWSESKDLGDGYRAVRMINNIRLNVDAFHGDKLSGGVHDGTIIVLWKWNNGDNQRWQIVPH